MTRKIATMTAAVLITCCLLCGPAAAAVDQAALDKALTDLPKYDWGQGRGPIDAIDAALVASHGDATARGAIEAGLIRVIQAKATRAAKQFACRKLALIGTAKCVAPLAAMLTDKDLSHLARHALEHLPYPAATKAIRDALGQVDGRLKVGMINSLAARRDTASAAALIGLLRNADKSIASAAAAALGRIGDKRAVAPLGAFLDKAPKDVKPAALDANLDLAAVLAAQGDKTSAGAIYDKLYAAGQPPAARRAALGGLAMVRPAQTAPLILKALSSNDGGLRGLAADMVATMPGSEATKTFAAGLGGLDEAGQVILLAALAQRQDPAARPAVLEAAAAASPAVAAAAVKALGTVGRSEDVGLLAKTAAKGDGKAASAARTSLARLGGADVNKTIVSALRGAGAKTKVELLVALAARSAAEATPAVTRLTKDPDAAVRTAAVQALGALGGATEVPVLLGLLKAGTDKAAAGTALTAICSRERAKAAPAVIAGLGAVTGDAKVALYNALGRCGGGKALIAAIAGTKSRDAKVADAATRVLCNWPDKAAVRPLLAVARSSDNKVHTVLAVRGVVRLVTVSGTPMAERWAALSAVMELAKGTQEKRAVLGGLREVYTIDALKLVAKYTSTKGLTEEAGAAAARIADRVGQKDKTLARSVLQDVIKNVRNRRTRGEAQRSLRKLGK